MQTQSINVTTPIIIFNRIEIRFWLLAIILIPQILFADIHEIRKSFHSALLDHEKIESFHTFIESNNDSSPTNTAYLAMAKALMAQKAWNPIDKYIYLREYQKLIANAIETDSLNLEIRFLRFSVEYHVPDWLGFSQNLDEDKDFIKANSKKVNGLMFDKEYVRYIAYFIKDTKLFSQKELEIILKDLENAQL